MSGENSRSLKSPQLGHIRCQSSRSLLPLLCYYFEVIWRRVKAARRLANGANQKRVLKTRDIPTLTNPSPPSHQRRLQPPLSARTTLCQRRDSEGSQFFGHRSLVFVFLPVFSDSLVPVEPLKRWRT